MNLLKKIYSNVSNISSYYKINRKEIQELKMLVAKKLVIHSAKASSILDAEFKVFSQWGDDGIIQYLINNISITNKVFVEFGVENYSEANTRFLLMNNNWSGLVIDGSEENIQYVKNDDIYWKYNLTAKHSFVTAENINDLIKNENISGNIGILHIDIDGNDYWIWKTINVVDADIVIVEYNSVFGSKRPITIPYDASFIRTKAHYSNLYYGTSLTSIYDLDKEKGYVFVGCNSAGNNAYFVKKEKAVNLKELSVDEGYVQSQFKESRNSNGQLTFLYGEKRLNEIKGLSVFNTRTNALELI
jgi:hypothetical protein